MFHQKRQALNFADFCLLAYMLMALVFIRAKVGFISAYTLFPLWMAFTWGTSMVKLMRDRYVSRVVKMFVLFMASMLLIRVLYGFDFEMTLLTVKNYVAAFFGWFAFAYYMKMGQEGKLRLFVLVMLGVVVVNALWNLKIESTVAFASRAATGGALEMQMDKGAGVNWDLADALSSGVVTFYGMVATALLIPASIYVARYSGRYAPLFLGFAVVAFLAVLRASYMLCLVYIGIGLYLAVIGFTRTVSLKLVWWFSLVLGIALFTTILIVFDPIISSLESISSDRENEVYATKFMEVRAAIQTHDLSYFPRIQNYLISLNTIKSNGLFGVGYDVSRSHTGGHSEVLDMVAQVGILGFLPYVLLFVALESYYRVNVECRSRYVRNLRYVLWVPLMVASFTNPTKGFDIWFCYFFTVPAMSLWMKPRYRVLTSVGHGQGMARHGIPYENPRFVF